jgi:hypothetical protein
MQQVTRGETHRCYPDPAKFIGLAFALARAFRCHSGAELWRRSKARGFRGSLCVISEWATRRRRAEKADALHVQKIPCQNHRAPDDRPEFAHEAATVTVAAILKQFVACNDIGAHSDETEFGTVANHDKQESALRGRRVSWCA